jgi:hypothetical protein
MKFNQLKIISDGTGKGTQLVDAQTNEPIELPIVEMTWSVVRASELDGTGIATVVLVLADVGLDVSVGLHHVGVTILPTNARPSAQPKYEAPETLGDKRGDICPKCNQPLIDHKIEAGVRICPRPGTNTS